MYVYVIRNNRKKGSVREKKAKRIDATRPCIEKQRANVRYGMQKKRKKNDVKVGRICMWM